MKNSPSCAHALQKTLNLVISRCCFADDGKKSVQKQNTRAERLFQLIKAIVWGVLVEVAVVVAKVP